MKLDGKREAKLRMWLEAEDYWYLKREKEKKAGELAQ